MGWWSRLFGGKAAPAHAAAAERGPAARREPVLDGTATPGGHTDLDRRAALELRANSPEFDEFIARSELDKGDNLPHGAEHLANLLIVDPAHPRWRALLDRYVAAAGPGLESLVPQNEQRQAATEALRAWTWHVQGRRDDAVSLLVDVARALQSCDLLHAWALDWLEPPGPSKGWRRRPACACMPA